MSSQHRLLSEHAQASILQTPLLLLSCSNSCLGRFDSKDEAILIYLATRQDRIYQGVPLTETFLGSETDINQSGREISKWINQPKHSILHSANRKRPATKCSCSYLWLILSPLSACCGLRGTQKWAVSRDNCPNM